MLTPIASNMTEVSTPNGNRVLYSYSTPVAAYLQGVGYCRTDKRWSVTTSRHINKWLDGAEAADRSQGFFDTLLSVSTNS
jgi:hypothetical protein